MREGWTYKRLGEVCEVEYGTRVVKQRDGGNVFPVYGGGGATFKMDVYNRENRVVVSRFAMSSKCTRMVKGKFYLNDSGLTLKSNSNSLLQIYLDTCILALNDKIYTLGRGVAQKNLKVDDLLRLSIPIPTHERQQSIVAELDKINELIGLKKSQLSDLDRLAQSIFYEMFGDPVENEKGWEMKKLNEVSESITDGDHMPPPKSERGIPFLTISDINKETRELDFSNTFFVPQDYYDGLKEERKARLNDLLYTVTGSYGIPVIVKTDKQFCFQRHIALIRPIQKMLTTTFLCYWALCPSVKGEADRVATGIAQKTVGLNSIRQFDIVLPPLPLQQSFAARITAIEQQKQRISTSIKDLETLLASRMQYWFDG